MPDETTSISIVDNYSINNYNQLDLPICRICHCGLNEVLSTFSSTSSTTSSSSSSSSSSDMDLITPCCCSGSLKYVHHYCLQQWIRSSNNKYCELCKYHFKMSIKFKPIHKVNCSQLIIRSFLCMCVLLSINM